MKLQMDAQYLHQKNVIIIYYYYYYNTIMIDTKEMNLEPKEAGNLLRDVTRDIFKDKHIYILSKRGQTFQQKGYSHKS